MRSMRAVLAETSTVAFILSHIVILSSSVPDLPLPTLDSYDEH